jgi:hypothetical protein
MHTHPITGQPMQPVFVHPRTGRVHWPIMGGSEPAPEPASAPEPDAAPADAQPTDPGYPANTPIAEMSPPQQAAYWRDKAQKHEKAWRGVVDKNLTPDQVLQMQQRLSDIERQSLSEQERAIADVRESALAEGRAAALQETNSTTVKALLEGALRMQGRTDEQVADTIRFLNLGAFVTNGVPDTAAILTYAGTPAPGPGTGRAPDFGAGHRGSGLALSARQQGLAQAEKRFGKKPEQ